MAKKSTRNYVTYSSRSGLTDADVVDIRLSDSSIRTLARDFIVPKSTIHDIKSGKTWAHVPDPVTVYKNYSVTPDGRVLSNKTNNALAQRLDKNGTLNVELTVNGKRKAVSVASLVARAFLGKNTTKVSYADNDSTNVHFTNIVVR